MGAEVDCILIEVGANKGKYMCMHLAPAEGDRGHSGFAEARPRRQLEFEAENPQETLAIKGEITNPDRT